MRLRASSSLNGSQRSWRCDDLARASSASTPRMMGSTHVAGNDANDHTARERSVLGLLARRGSRMDAIRPDEVLHAQLLGYRRPRRILSRDQAPKPFSSRSVYDQKMLAAELARPSGNRTDLIKPPHLLCGKLLSLTVSPLETAASAFLTRSRKSNSSPYSTASESRALR